MNNELAKGIYHPAKPKGNYTNNDVAMYIVKQGKMIDKCLMILNPN